MKKMLCPAVAALLAACGGGDGGSTTSFPLRAGYQAYVAAGSSQTYAVSGSCTGTARVTNGRPVPTVFEGVPGYAVTQTTSVSFTNCSPASTTETVTAYYDGNYAPLGSSSASGEYVKFDALPSAAPVAVSVGDSAGYGTQTIYADGGKTVVLGRNVLGYAIEPETAGTAVANLVTRTFDASNQLSSTTQERYRIGVDGTFTPLSVDVQYGTLHLVLTRP